MKATQLSASSLTCPGPHVTIYTDGPRQAKYDQTGKPWQVQEFISHHKPTDAWTRWSYWFETGKEMDLAMKRHIGVQQLPAELKHKCIQSNEEDT